uniref:Uncharacterized protein n=1 Tax=uncultured nuHF2 cluster bacterium HF0770_42C12 TaxID=723593 RepID=E7C821_9BACT|nr:hypothetical protein [uncultured nuHF2 cluster bacterium HF0770_42C12]
MKRITLIAIALTVICSGNGYAYDKRDGNFGTVYNVPTCRQFLKAYASVTFQGPKGFTASYDFLEYDNWVFGYISAFNVLVDNLQADRLKTLKMTSNDTRRWLGAWCRDNMSGNVQQGISVLFGR